MGAKGEKERGQTARQSRDTEDRTGQDTTGDTRQTDKRKGERKEYVIYLRERRREKTPLRLAKACKYAYIHITQYRGVVAVYCTFFYIL